MKQKIVLMLSLFLVSFSLITAQNSVTLSGIIKDKNDKTPLPFVNIILKTEKER